MPPKASTPSSKAGGAGSSKPPSSAKSSAGKKKESSGTSNADFLKSENVLQAVLLADSFQVKFRPLTQQKPKVSRAPPAARSTRHRKREGEEQ